MFDKKNRIAGLNYSPSPFFIIHNVMSCVLIFGSCYCIAETGGIELYNVFKVSKS